MLSFESIESHHPATVIDVLARDHHVLRDMIGVLTGHTPEPSPRRTLIRFLRVLRAHEHAEEATLMPALEASRMARERVLEIYEDHRLLDSARMNVESRLRGDEDWNEELASKAQTLAEVVEAHLDREEEELFPLARAALTPSVLRDLQSSYEQVRRAALGADEHEHATSIHG